MRNNRRIFKRLLAGMLAVLMALTVVYTGEPKVKVQAAGTKLIAFTFDVWKFLKLMEVKDRQLSNIYFISITDDESKFDKSISKIFLQS